MRAGSAEAPQGGDFLYLIYLKEHKRGDSLNFNKFHFKFNRLWTLILGAYVCNVDLMGGHESCENVDGSKATATQKENCTQGPPPAPELSEAPGLDVGRTSRAVKRVLRFIRSSSVAGFNPARPSRISSWKRGLRMGWIPRAILVLYFLLTLVVVANIYYLYKFDITRLRLKRVRELIQAHGPDRMVAMGNKEIATMYTIEEGEYFVSGGCWAISLSNFEHILTSHLGETKQVLNYLGCKFINWGMIYQCTYLFLLLLIFVVYLVIQQCLLWLTTPDLALQRDLIDFHDEQRRVDICCENQVLKYLESTRVHILTRKTNARLFGPFAHLTRGRGCESERHHQEEEEEGSTNNNNYHKPSSKWLSVSDGYSHYERADKFMDASAAAAAAAAADKGRDTRTSDHKTCCSLVQMLTSGALRPLNRSNHWIEKRNWLQFALHLNIIFYGITYNVATLYVPYKSSPGGFDLGETCGLTLVVLVNLALSYYWALLVVSCLDQVVLVNRILAIIHKCISLNQREFSLYTRLATSSSGNANTLRINDGMIGNCDRATCAATVNRQRWQRNKKQQIPSENMSSGGVGNAQQQQRAAIIDRMNSNYLFTLMTYKIFVAQLVPFRRTLRGVFLIVFSLSFIIPVLARIHVPYIDQDFQASANQLRLIGFITSVVILLPINSVCLPICYVHSRCQKLYTALSSLLAHIAQVRKYRDGLRIYNEHAVLLLVKELSNPKLMLDQFVVQSLGFGGTLPNFVRAHFWWGLVALSILVDPQGDKQGEYFGSLYSDPLGVWSFHLI